MQGHEYDIPRRPLLRGWVNKSSKLLLQALLALTPRISATILGRMRWGRIVLNYYAERA